MNVFKKIFGVLFVAIFLVSVTCMYAMDDARSVARIDDEYKKEADIDEIDGIAQSRATSSDIFIAPTINRRRLKDLKRVSDAGDQAYAIRKLVKHAAQQISMSNRTRGLKLYQREIEHERLYNRLFGSPPKAIPSTSKICLCTSDHEASQDGDDIDGVVCRQCGLRNKVGQAICIDCFLPLSDLCEMDHDVYDFVMCWKCTFINKITRHVCKQCRSPLMPHMGPCSECTLINEEGETICKKCGVKL